MGHIRRRPRALFVGSGYAGHRSRFLNLRSHIGDDPRLDSTWRLVSGWHERGVLERLPILPRGVKGRIRATLEASSILAMPRPDVIWTAIGSDLAPLAWSLMGPLHRPMVMDLDWTGDQREQAAFWYYGRPGRTGMVATANRLREQIAWSRVTLFTPWSEWTADALRARGVTDERICILPPGVDLERWQPPTSRAPIGDRRLRLLFVGGDFARKGGELLLEVMRGPVGEHFELDIVTRESIAPTRGTRVHQAEPNSPLLQSLYQHADLFVMPSLAECFGIATIEAMAVGLPVIVSDRGASREIVEDGCTGFVIVPGAQTLHDRLMALWNERATVLRSVGAAARLRAIERFNGKDNDRRIADIVADLAAASGS